MPIVSSATIDAQRRIRLPDGVEEELSWIPIKRGPAIECRAFKGAYGGIQIAPEDSDLAKQLRDFQQSTPKKLKADASDEAWTHLKRFFDATWLVSLVVDANHYRIQLPATIAAIGWLDLTKGTKLVVLADGDLLELWNTTAFEKYMSEIASSRSVRIAEHEEE